MEQTVVEGSIEEQTHNHSRRRVASTGIFILVADDNAVNRLVYSRILERLGHTVATVCDGQEALDYLCKTSGKRQPDIVFMDTMMPVVDGYEATRRMRNDADMYDERMRSLPVIALSANAMLGVRETCLEAGMNDCITSPVRMRDLDAAMLKWISPVGP